MKGTEIYSYFENVVNKGIFLEIRMKMWSEEVEWNEEVELPFSFLNMKLPYDRRCSDQMVKALDSGGLHWMEIKLLKCCSSLFRA